MKTKLERRFTAQPLQADDDTKIRGYAAVFNSPSEDMGFIEYIDPHAFDNALNDDVRGLVNHDPNQLLGRTTSGTMRLTVDAKGLKYEIDPPDTQTARDLITLMKRGDINQSSFGFYCLDDKWELRDGKQTRTIMEAKLTDCSPVTYPAYAATTSEARCFPDGLPESVLEHRADGEAPGTDDAQADEAGNADDAAEGNCDCECAGCQNGDCADCSCDPCECDNCDCGELRSMQCKIKLAEAV